MNRQSFDHQSFVGKASPLRIQIGFLQFPFEDFEKKSLFALKKMLFGRKGMVGEGRREGRREEGKGWWRVGDWRGVVEGGKWSWSSVGCG